ncbi:MAG TPA: hypothetical protein PLQ71_19410, partial [Nitrospira sp.]|nr:hypothetical protein [Nitrospira sp.]
MSPCCKRMNASATGQEQLSNHEPKTKTPPNSALSGVFVVAAESLRPVSWRARTYAITNALRF